MYPTIAEVPLPSRPWQVWQALSAFDLPAATSAAPAWWQNRPSIAAATSLAITAVSVMCLGYLWVCLVTA
jgi:hypothetical protein